MGDRSHVGAARTSSHRTAGVARGASAARNHLSQQRAGSGRSPGVPDPLAALHSPEVARPESKQQVESRDRSAVQAPAGTCTEATPQAKRKVNDIIRTIDSDAQGKHQAYLRYSTRGENHLLPIRAMVIQHGVVAIEIVDEEGTPSPAPSRNGSVTLLYDFQKNQVPKLLLVSTESRPRQSGDVRRSSVRRDAKQPAQAAAGMEPSAVPAPYQACFRFLNLSPEEWHKTKGAPQLIVANPAGESAALDIEKLTFDAARQVALIDVASLAAVHHGVVTEAAVNEMNVITLEFSFRDKQYPFVRFVEQR